MSLRVGNGCADCLRLGWSWVRASDVPHLRKRRLLRLVAWQARNQAFPCDQASDHEIVREGRGLAMVLRRREIRLGGAPPPRNRARDPVDVANVRQRCAALPIDLREAVTQRSPRAEETLADIGRRNAQLPGDLF